MKMQLQPPQAMIFDMDGTLFRTETVILSAYHATFDQMRREGVYVGETPPEERMLGSLGMLLEDIWKRVLPDASRQVRERADELFIRYEMEEIRAGRGEFYPEVVPTLRKLRERGIRLFVASNGLEAYVKGVVKYNGLEEEFEGLYSAGEYQTRSKVDLVRILLDKHRIDSAWMVGDRSSDVEAGRENGLFTVGCAYAGFGDDAEIRDADAIIASFGELLELLKA
jgi:phosphoglycolate phosphatase